MASTLWQILIKIEGNATSSTLSCDECFTLLDHLVSQISSGPMVDTLYQAALKHWQLCPNCREHHLQLLQQMETDYLARHPNKTIGSLLICQWPQADTDDDPAAGQNSA